MFLDALISCNVQASAPWCVGGDFNGVPSHSHVEDVAGAMHGSICRLGVPTRWKGHREIDFFIANRPDITSPVSRLPLKFSDHKILQMQLPVPVQCLATASLQKAARTWPSRLMLILSNSVILSNKLGNRAYKKLMVTPTALPSARSRSIGNTSRPCYDVHCLCHGK